MARTPQADNADQPVGYEPDLDLYAEAENLGSDVLEGLKKADAVFKFKKTPANGPKEGPNMLTGTIEKKFVDGNRVAVTIGGKRMSAFLDSERMDDVTRDVLTNCEVGHEIQYETYENKGYVNISAALWVDVDGAHKKVAAPPAAASSGGSKWAGKSGGGGGGYKGYPPAEVETAKYPAFAQSYAKDVTLDLIRAGKLDAGLVGSFMNSLAISIYNNLKGMK